jgi:hypothetical protein
MKKFKGLKTRLHEADEVGIIKTDKDLGLKHIIILDDPLTEGKEPTKEETRKFINSVLNKLETKKSKP